MAKSHITDEFRNAVLDGRGGEIWVSGGVMASLIEHGTGKTLATAMLLNPCITVDGVNAALDADDTVFDVNAESIGRFVGEIRLHTEDMMLACGGDMVPDPPIKIDSWKVTVRWDNGPRKIVQFVDEYRQRLDV